MHELDKSRRKLEVEKEELQNGLEEVKDNFSKYSYVL